MIIFSNKYTEDIEKLRVTIHCLGEEIGVVVFEDNAFLPKGVSSPYEYYISNQNCNEHAEKELFYDSLVIPEYWEIRPNGATAGIYYMGCERATVYFCEQRCGRSGLREALNAAVSAGNPAADSEDAEYMAPLEKRSIQRIEWHTDNGWIYRIDLYNKYGLKYASEFRDEDGNVESKVFYSDNNQEVIVEQPGNDVVTLVEKGNVKGFFNSRTEFIEYNVAEVSRNEKKMIFVQNEKMLDALRIKPEEKQNWDFACFPNEQLLNKYIDLGGKNGLRFYAIPEYYPQNETKAEALILTASDQIEKIKELVYELPSMTFHIAAHTLMSDKLNKLGELESVNLYPCVSREMLDTLWDRCDFYLDINHRYEIYDAVNAAHQNNLLIMGFENTVHHKELLVNGCIYPEQEYKKMVLVIEYVLKSPVLMQKLLLAQQIKKIEIWKAVLKSEEEL